MTCQADNCDRRHCTVCRRSHLTPDEAQTCTPCIGQVRRDLHEIVELVALAGEQLDGWPARSPSVPRNGPRSSDTTVPGGDLLVALAPGSDGRSETAETWSASDPIPVDWLLREWEDDFRDHLDVPSAAAGQPLTAVIRFLNHHTATMAQHHPAIADYAADIHKLRTQLETALHAGDQPTRTGVTCLDCAGQLIRSWTDEGLSDMRACTVCRRLYAPAEYWYAVRKHLESAAHG